MSECEKCLKSQDLCVCEFIRPLQTQKQVLILQHPQEPDQELGSARLAHLSLPNSNLKIGLSWRSLKAVLGKEAPPSRWGALYLGSGVKDSREKNKMTGPALQWVGKKGEPLNPQPDPAQIDGLIILDGTWSQAKTLWWRNPWLLKVRRAILLPSRPSLYRELRKEPRRECLSTIESIAEALQAIGEPTETSEGLRKIFKLLIEKQRARSRK